MERNLRSTPPATEAAAVKRRANELMRSALVDVVDTTPFVCECDDPSCVRPVWLSKLEYDVGRRRAGWRPLSPDHSSPARAA